jgi:succinyl-diaminopimelate desuccinylase
VNSENISPRYRHLHESILEMTGDLVAASSQVGLDSVQAVSIVIKEWCSKLSLQTTMFKDSQGIEVAILVSKNCSWSNEKQLLCLNACADTAPVGIHSDWLTDPLKLTAVEGWLYGRGAADSKVAVAIFTHLISVIPDESESKSVIALFDLDEHSGKFQGLTEYLKLHKKVTQGIYIGYPGIDEIKCGARGLVRLKVVFKGEAHHSGSSRVRRNPIPLAAEFITKIRDIDVGVTSENFELPGRLTVTAFNSGAGFGATPSMAEIYIDVRCTLNSDVEKIIETLTKIAQDSSQATSDVEVLTLAIWPAYTVGVQHWLVKNLASAARQNLASPVEIGLSGPTNIGNLASMFGVPATCGFGVQYRSIHAPNEGFDPRTVLPVLSTYATAVASWIKIP